MAFFAIFSVSYAVLRKAHKSTNTSDDGEDDKKGRKHGTNYEYIFMARKEPQLEREKITIERDNDPVNVVEDNTSPIVSPPVLTKETQVEKCQRIIEKAFGKQKNKKHVVGEPYTKDIGVDQVLSEADPANVKCEAERQSKETQVERCQRIIEKAFGRQKSKKDFLGEPYYCMDVDIDETRREIKEAEKAKLINERSVEKPVTDDRIQFGVYKKYRDEPPKEDTLSPPLEAQTEAAHKSAKRGGTQEPGTVTNHMEDLNLMQQTLNIYLTPSGKGNDDNVDTTLQPEKPNLIRIDGKIDTESTLNATVTATVTAAEPKESYYYDGVDDSLPLRQSILKHDIDEYVQKQEQMEDKLFCDMEHMYENSEGQSDGRTFKKSDPIGFEAQPVKYSWVMSNALNRDPSREPVISNIYSESYWLNDAEDPNSPAVNKAEPTEKVERQNERYANVYWHVDTRKGTKSLLSTTAKETEEQLTQKVEHIDETPLVEAHKPKIEGFNVTPRVLGDSEPTSNYFTDKRADSQHTGAIPRVDPNSYDEVAKRCLNKPTGKIDEILLKEMEKLGVPMTGKRESISPSPVIEDDLVQMDVLNQQPRSRTAGRKDLELESQGYEGVAQKLFERKPIIPAQQSVQYSEEEKPETKYDVVTTERKFVIHPNQVLIDPYDKKTIAQDTEEYDANTFHDPTQKFAYFYVPEKKKDGTYSLKKQNSPLNNAKVNTTPTPKMYDDVDINDPWDGYQVDPTTETDNTDRVYAKWIDKTPSSEAAKMTTNSIWDEEQSNPSDSKYAHNLTSTTVDKITPCSSPDTCGTHNMWREQQFNPQLQSYVNQNVNKKPEATAARPATYHDSPDNAHYNYYNKARTHEGYTNTMGSTASHYYMPDGNWDKSMHVHNMEPINRANINVSDGIWDEQLLEERFVKPEKKYPKANKNWNQDHLQSESRLAYSTPHQNPAQRPEWSQDNMQHERPLQRPHYRDVTPRPQVQVSDNSRMTYETNFEEEQPEVYPEYHLNIAESEEKSYEEKMQKVAKFLQADSIWETTRVNTAAINSANLHTATMPAVNIPDTLNTLPKLNEAVSLTELLRRVRERSRIIECKNELKALGVEVDPIESKCGTGKASPRCSPMAPRHPPTNPLPPPPFGLPPLKQRPRTCPPKRKPRSNKCSSCEMDMSLGLRLGPQVAHSPIACPEMVCEMNVAGALEISLSRSRADLTDDIINRLQELGKILGVVLRQGKTEVLECAVVKNRRGPNVVLARDYEPWAPIPSWPSPKKEKRKEPPCEPGCKIFPPTRATFDPPCDPRPCQGFPKKTFAVLDCFAVSLGENKVYDLGDF